MNMDLLAYIVPMFIAFILSVLTCIFSWKRKPANGSIPLAHLMGAVSVWILMQLFAELSTDFTMKLFWDNCKFLGVVLVPVAWLQFSASFTKRIKTLSRGYLVLLSIIPIITTFFIWTNKFFGLFQTDYHLEYNGQIASITATKQIWFWVHTYYSYALIFLALVFLIQAFFQSPSIYRKQFGILLIGAFIPFVANIFSIFDLVEFPYSDITPLALLCTGILFFFGLFKLKILDLVPIARHIVIENMKDMIMVLDNQRRIVDLNPEAMNFLGCKNKSIIGQPVQQVLSKWSDLLLKYRDMPDVEEDIQLERDSTKCFYNLRISPILDNAGRTNGSLIVLRDITELKEAIHGLKESREAADEANKAKSQFLANMSHELRTPMNAIIGLSDLMANMELSSEQKKYVDTIRSSASSLLNTVNDILDFSKIEVGSLEIENIEFDFAELVDITIKPFIVESIKKGVDFKYQGLDSVPRLLKGDPTRLKQILVNLLSNAVKFTSAGKVQVNFKGLDISEDKIQLNITVTDTGIGIPEDKFEGLFNSFNQVDNSSTRKYGGTGLGLSITKSLCSLMNGYIDFESKLGSGSRFSVFLPFNVAEKAPEEVSKKVSLPQPVETQKDIHILLAEDNKVNQMLMLTLLRKRNINVDIADNGRIALDMYKKGSYDLVLMDVQMPEMDGYETTSAIRDEEKTNGTHTPIVALTANAMKGDREKCLESGMDDYLSKPVRSENLFETIEKYV